MRLLGYRAILILLLPIILIINLVRRLWDEIKGIPYMLWLEVRQDWDDFASAWHNGRPF